MQNPACSCPELTFLLSYLEERDYFIGVWLSAWHLSENTFRFPFCFRKVPKHVPLMLRNMLHQSLLQTFMIVNYVFPILAKIFYHVRCFLFATVHKICVEQKFKILYNEADFWSRACPVYKDEIARVLLSNQCTAFS